MAKTKEVVTPEHVEEQLTQALDMTLMNIPNPRPILLAACKEALDHDAELPKETVKELMKGIEMDITEKKQRKKRRKV